MRISRFNPCRDVAVHLTGSELAGFDQTSADFGYHSSSRLGFFIDRMLLSYFASLVRTSELAYSGKHR